MKGLQPKLQWAGVGLLADESENPWALGLGLVGIWAQNTPVSERGTLCSLGNAFLISWRGPFADNRD